MNLPVKYLTKVLALLLLFFPIKILIAQTGGISGSKISAFNVDVIDHHIVEFEPALHHLRSGKHWDENGTAVGHAASGDSIKYITGLDFRVTYGLADRLEIGMTFSNDLLLASTGMRYVLYDHARTGMALIAGVNVPLGNQTVSRTFRQSSATTNAGGGVVFTAYFSPDLSLDLNAQYFRCLRTTSDCRRCDWFFNGDLGYYLFSGKLQLIAGFGYQQSRFETADARVFTLFPGITVETGKNYIIVLNSIIDVWGINMDRSAGIAMALTITLE